ncbi:MAG: hypothetical protein WA667_24805 [Candidatus Nitrosopolaris sp.]
MTSSPSFPPKSKRPVTTAAGLIKAILIYTPAQLAIKPKYSGDVEIKIDDHGALHHG